jgi:hypothetical protein
MNRDSNNVGQGISRGDKSEGRVNEEGKEG